MEEDFSFRSVLLSVIAGHEPPTVLLDHPEFQRRANRFSKLINRSEGSEDLVQQVYLQILQSGHLKPADLQNEEQFFKWFFVIARNHLIAKSRDCVEPSKGWPNTTAELPFNELDQFFEHADVCPYHRRLLLVEEVAEDQKFDSLISTARGLDPQRVIHNVEHLNTATDDLKERLHLWNEAALTRGLLFDYIGLYNAGKRIATVSRFFDVRIHVSTHELDPRAGLQIRGLTGKDLDYEVPLGTCTLIGAPHKNVEQYIHLENGFTVGISIEQLTRRKFTLGFRCVRTEVINKEKAGLNEKLNGEGGVSRDSGGIDLGPPTQQTTVPAYIAASLLESGRRHANAWGLGFILVLLLPAFQSLNTRERVEPGGLSKSGVQAQSPTGGEEIPTNKLTVQNRSRHRSKRAVGSSNQTSSRFLRAIQEELREKIAPATNVRLTVASRARRSPMGTRVETVPIWQVRVYETKPRLELLVTHFVDNEKMKDQLEQLLPEPSMRSVVLANPSQFELPQTGYEIKWKTIYLHEQMVSVEATVDGVGKNKGPSTSIFKEACATAGCEARLLSGNAIANVYGYINPAWRPQIVFAMKSISKCLFEDVPPGGGFPNVVQATAVSGSTFDEIPNCPQVSDGPPTN